MPRSVQEIINHADELARRFEEYEPRPEDERDPVTYMALRDAALARSRAEQVLRDAVDAARGTGHTWADVGAVLGTSGEAARQRYSTAS